MAKKKSRAAASNSQVKSSLKQLRKLGLYNPKAPRKAPTRYAISLTKQYKDVLAGRVEAVKVPRSVAKELKGQFRVKQGKKSGIALVPKTGGMSARYSKKEKTIVRTAGAFRLVPLKDRMVLLRGDFPKLKRGELSVVVRIGNNYVDFYSLDEVRRAMAEYDPQKTTLWQFPYISKVVREAA